MRTNLTKKHYTKPERIFGRLLQENQIPFRAKVKIRGREVDFIIGKVAVEINGHEQNPEKNRMLVEEGYTPIHFHNSEVYNKELLTKFIQKL